MNDSDPPRERAHGGALVAGLILIGVGISFLLVNLGLVDFELPWRWWPLVLVAIGAGKLLTAGDGDELRGGTWLVLIGVWMLVNVQGWFGLSWHNSWPLVIVAAGVMIVWKGFGCERGACRRHRRLTGGGEAEGTGGEAA